MDLLPLPPAAAWRHRDARDGFECLFATSDAGGTRLRGRTAAVEDGEAWWFGYDIRVDTGWRTREATLWNGSAAGERTRHVEADGEGRWRVDGVAAPELDGCLDIDLEASACTNTLPVHRMAFRPGVPVDAPAAYFRAVDISALRIEQAYVLTATPAPGEGPSFDYTSPTFDYAGLLTCDPTGLVTTYPDLATRHL
jgi:hypothetical protein